MRGAAQAGGPDAPVGFVEELKRQWLAMIDAVQDPLVLVNRDYEIVRANSDYFARAQVAAGLSIRDLAGRRCFEVFAGRTSPCVHCRLGDASAGPVYWETQALAPGRFHQIRATPVGEAGSELAVVHYRDVTDWKALQESLARADKLAALGKLAGGVAHEISSPLAGILAFSQMALKELGEESAVSDDLREIQEAARKCKVILEGMLGFARQEKPSDSQVFDVFESVRAALRLTAPLMRKARVQLVLELPEAKALVLGSGGKLEQVVVNLVTNAVYAMRAGGGHLVLRGRLDEGVVLEVTDSGEGMDPEVLAKIFDPFFTTKPVGEGTGLGLSVTYSIVRQHGGTIFGTSSPGMGTTMVVRLPLAAS